MAYIGTSPSQGVRHRYIFTATSGQTTFSGADDDSRVLYYNDSKFLDVYLNGILLKPDTDYTANNKTSVVLSSGAALNDIVEIIAYDTFNVFSGIYEGDTTFNSNFLPGADVTYDLGSPTYRWRDLYISGSTIDLGGAKISQDNGTGTIALVAAPTASNPNPSALVVTSSGATVAVNTTGGTVDFNDVATELSGNSGFSGSYNDLTNTPTSITDFGIVDGTNGQVLTTDGSGNFTFEDVSGGGGGVTTGKAIAMAIVFG